MSVVMPLDYIPKYHMISYTYAYCKTLQWDKRIFWIIVFIIGLGSAPVEVDSDQALSFNKS